LKIKFKSVFLNPASFACLLLCLAGAPAAAGCQAVPETDMQTYIMLVGIDEGVRLPYQITFQYAAPKNNEPDTLTVEAQNLWDAMQIADAFTSRVLNLEHNRVIIVSQAVADRGMEPVIEMLTWDNSIRRECFLLMTLGKARDFIKSNESNVERYPSRHFEFVMDGNTESGMILISDIHSFYTALKSPQAQAAVGLVGVNEGNKLDSGQSGLEDFDYIAGNIPREGRNQTEIMGMAVFLGDRPVGYLSGGECRCYNMITGRFHSGVMSFTNVSENPDAELVLTVEKSGPPSVRVRLEDGKADISVNVRLRCWVESFNGPESFRDPEQTAQIEEKVGGEISREMTNLVQKVQKEMKSDAFGFCDYARANFWTLREWEDYDWQKAFESGQIRINVQTEINPGDKERALTGKGQR
jgi:spore germination protein KC